MRLRKSPTQKSRKVSGDVSAGSWVQVAMPSSPAVAVEESARGAVTAAAAAKSAAQEVRVDSGGWDVGRKRRFLFFLFFLVGQGYTSDGQCDMMRYDAIAI